MLAPHRVRRTSGEMWIINTFKSILSNHFHLCVEVYQKLPGEAIPRLPESLGDGKARSAGGGWT
jgi:hypothetical protein